MMSPIPVLIIENITDMQGRWIRISNIMHVTSSVMHDINSISKHNYATHEAYLPKLMVNYCTIILIQFNME